MDYGWAWRLASGACKYCYKIGKSLRKLALQGNLLFSPPCGSELQLRHKAGPTPMSPRTRSRPSKLGGTGTDGTFSVILFAKRVWGLGFRHNPTVASVRCSHPTTTHFPSRESTGIHFCTFVQFRWPSPRRKISRDRQKPARSQLAQSHFLLSAPDRHQSALTSYQSLLSRSSLSTFNCRL
jgi:hypothetical protein